MLVKCVDDRCQHCQEDGVFSRIAAWIKQIPFAVGDAPVVVLARTIHARKGLFMEQADQPVTVGNLPKHLHNNHVVVNR